MRLQSRRIPRTWRTQLSIKIIDCLKSRDKYGRGEKQARFLSNGNPGLPLSAVFWLAGWESNAADLRTQNPYNKVFAALAATEYPAEAAAEVKKADESKQASVTVLVVRASVGLCPSSAPAVAAAIAREVPEMAARAAYTAAAEQPKQAVAIATAAATAAPGQAGKIVSHLCTALPSQYRTIALAVAKVAPGSTREILDAIAESNPSLKASIDQSLASQKGNLDLADLAATLDRAENTNRLSGVGGGPYITPGPQPIIPPGGYNYSRP